MTNFKQREAKGGRSFAQVAAGRERGYTFLVADVHNRTFTDDLRDLIQAVDDAFEAVEKCSGRSIVKFVVGKSSVERRAREQFDSANPDTWIVSSDGLVGSRWSSGSDPYSRNGFNGLIVIACFTKKHLPTSTAPGINCEDYTIALESGLQSHFAFDSGDGRIKFTPGTGQRGNKHASVIYVVFKLAKKPAKRTNRK